MAAHLLPLLSLVACMSTKAWRAPDVPTTPTTPALMVSGLVETRQEAAQNPGVATMVAAAAGNLQMDEFGATVRGKLAPWLAKQGFTIAPDADRAKSLQKVDWGEAANALSVLSGVWVDPDGAAMRVAGDTLFRGGTLEKVAAKLDTGASPEAYLFTVVTVTEDPEWLFFRRPIVKLSVIVADEKGREVLRARAYGRGKTTPLVTDRTNANLSIALDEALDHLAAVPVMALD